MSSPTFTLRELGWGAQFQCQLDLDEIAATVPLRVAAIHRAGPDLIGAAGPRRVAADPTGLAVGDWLLADPATGALVRVLERKTLLQRRAAGTGRAAQLIAANVDTLFVVSSCNADFNPARIERYLALARQAGIVPVLVLTKADTCDDPAAYVAASGGIDPMLVVEAVNARDPVDVARLAPWCGVGETVALAGSSGVGKSTLINALAGTAVATQGIREDDAKGRHTTTARALHRLPAGGWLIDTPGMRELRLHDVAEGIDAVFDDVAALAGTCRFTDCAHEREPGCAVQAAIAAGDLDPDRLARWRKLRREDARNTASLAEQRRADREFGKHVRSIQARRRLERGGP